MRKALLAIGLLSLGCAATGATAAEFGFVPAPTPVEPLKDYGQIQAEVNRNRMDNLRIEMMQRDLEERRQRQQQTYYCRTPDGRFVACR